MNSEVDYIDEKIERSITEGRAATPLTRGSRIKQELKQSERLQDRSMQSINRKSLCSTK